MKVWKIRKWKGTCWWSFNGLFLFLIFWPLGYLGAAELMETVSGKVLIGSRPHEDGLQSIVSRDPFNWSDEFVGQYLAMMRSRQDLFSGLHMSGIVWDLLTPLAIINNVLLKEGEKVEQAMVVKIFKDSVLLEKDGLRHTLNFEQRIIDLGTQHAKGAGGE